MVRAGQARGLLACSGAGIRSREVPDRPLKARVGTDSASGEKDPDTSPMTTRIPRDTGEVRRPEVRGGSIGNGRAFVGVLERQGLTWGPVMFTDTCRLVLGCGAALEASS